MALRSKAVSSRMDGPVVTQGRSYTEMFHVVTRNISVLYLLGVKGERMSLYENLGFKAHPFAKTNADEEPNLAEYFVPPPFYDGVLGDPTTPTASVVLAPRGGGKTALRRMLEEAASDKNYLAVSYDRFEFSAGQQVKDINLQYHLRNIISRLLVAYLSHLADDPDLLTKLTKDDRRRISLFVHSYLGDITGDGIQDILKELKGLPDRFREFWREKVGFLESVVNLLLKNYGLESIDLPTLKNEEKTLDETYKYQLEYLGKLVRSIGFSAVYVLIDKPDETELTGNNAEATYRLIQPLIRDLELLGLDGFTFKFFLWDQVESFYRKDARPDRVHEYRLSWSRKGLERLLSKRLKSFSDGRIQSFRDLCTYDLPYDPDSVICLIANHSPRNVIRICEKIISAQAEIESTANKVSSQAIDQGVLAYCNQVAMDNYPEEYIKDIQRVGRELFTINYLANDVFKVNTNAARNKIKNWQNAGLVRQIGTVSVETSNKPLNFYYITDPAIIRLIHRNIPLEHFLKDRWLPCGYCETDNLANIELYPEGNIPLCASCGQQLF